MVYIVRIKPSAKKELDRIPEQYGKRVRAALLWLTENPFVGKKLHGEYEGYYTLRVWPYRIIYVIERNELIITVIRIGHRQGVY